MDKMAVAAPATCMSAEVFSGVRKRMGACSGFLGLTSAIEAGGT
jgi:hypothetical protein